MPTGAARPEPSGLPIQSISVRGASEHNLKAVSLDLPHETLTVFTGVSGSGKSSLAFDTIFKEGQRRYVESLSSYARQFLGQLERPQVEHIEGLAPAAAIDQRSAGRNPRSTVGTITEISDFLRLLYARVGELYCHACGSEIEALGAQQIAERIAALPDKSRVMLLAPVVRHRRGEHRELMGRLRARGFVRARIDGEVVRLDPTPNLSRTHWHDIDVIVDRITIGTAAQERITGAVETALELAEGLLLADWGEEQAMFSSGHGCPQCGAGVEPPEPALFSFNSRRGSCPSCHGLGTTFDFDPGKLIAHPERSIADGALALTNRSGWTLYLRMDIQGWESLGEAFGFSVDTPWNQLSQQVRDLIMGGAGRRKYTERINRATSDGRWRRVAVRERTWRGVLPILRNRCRRGTDIASWALPYMSDQTCGNCQGARLRPEALAVRLAGRNIAQTLALTVAEAEEWFAGLSFGPRQARIAGPILREIRTRLEFLVKVGLGYLNLDRRAPSLSGGEAQRIRLAAQIGSRLEGVLYVLDEPSIGLHQKDNLGLLQTLAALRERGNTVVVVEHDEATIRSADHVVDFGPGAGDDGGQIVASGAPAKVLAEKHSLTAAFLRGDEQIPTPRQRRTGSGKSLKVLGAAANNLCEVDVEFPLATLITVTGVSGSGKSSLVDNVLRRALARRLHSATADPGPHRGLEGVEEVDKVIEIDQAPIGRNPRSNPATYTGVFTHIRRLFSQLPEARARGFAPGRFSFNVSGGRCEACKGRGSRQVEMQFMGDVEVVCEVCEGRRFNRETLKVLYKGQSIADVLAMRIDHAHEFFANLPAVARILQTLVDVGLGYLQLGQPATTLSGGEAQRIKLSSELARPATGRTFYILDEPTTGLHFADVRNLLAVLDRLVDSGNTVLVVEHNPDVIKCADWVIDLGPDGGAAGGRLMFAGTPEDCAGQAVSHTGKLLAGVLDPDPRPVKARKRRRARRAKDRMLTISGARKHNLRSVDVQIPKDRLTVVTGVSGSGKSTLAMDTVFAEGQRRFVECLSAYARQFLGRPDDAQVESISGLAPAIAISQENASRTPRSLVATSTEIYDYLRVLYARAGRPFCPNGHGDISGMTSTQVADQLAEAPTGTRLVLSAPIDIDPGQDLGEQLRGLLREGFVRARLDGALLDLAALPDELDAGEDAVLEVVIDRLAVRPDRRDRLGDSVELTLARGEGRLSAQLTFPDGESAERSFTTSAVCPQCGSGVGADLTPRHFSFNSYLGACPACDGLGTLLQIDPELAVPDPGRTYAGGAVALIESDPMQHWWGRWARALAAHFGIDLYRPWRDLPEEHRRLLLYGAGEELIESRSVSSNETGESEWISKRKWDGFIPLFARWHERSQNPDRQRKLERFMRTSACNTCGGDRLQPALAAVRFAGLTLPRVLRMDISDAAEHFAAVSADPAAFGLSANEREIAAPALREIANRLTFLLEVGLGYLAMDRRTATLSGGEAQRIRLATQIGTRLVGAIYVLDEPTIGLHARDIERLLRSLNRLRDIGNTVIVIEHDEQTIRAADHVIDIGPGAGERGGEIVASGSVADVIGAGTATGRALSGGLGPTKVKMLPRPARGHLSVLGAAHNNLREIDVAIPVGCFCAVTGVSGSGKSSLVNGILARALRKRLHRASALPGRHAGIEGAEQFDKAIVVDQSPIGRSARSTPATYVGAFDAIRHLYARLPESRALGFAARRFSFNEGAGRCPACRGEGQVRVEMQFLADVEMQCEVCQGRRFNQQTLRVLYRGASIADVLGMTVEEARAHFANVPGAKRPLDALADVGLSYVRLGQSARTLSGGEAQRVKLAAELARPATGRTIYIFDEPTVGLHPADVRELLDVINRLVSDGNSVLAIEHDLTVIASADWVIDLGPEGGAGGGRLVAEGSPLEVSACKQSHTGSWLAKFIRQVRERHRSAAETAPQTS